MQQRPFVADNPALLLVRESDRIQARRCPRWSNGPVSAPGTGKQDLAARTDRPTMRVIAKENMRQVFAATFSQAPPGQATVIRAHHEPIAARGPAHGVVCEIDSDQARI